MNIQLSDHFDTRRLLRFTLPSIAMMIFTSIYGVVDGFFVSNFVGKTPFAAVNFVMPLLMVLGTFGFMFGTGGGALIAKTLGEGDQPKARALFSFFVYAILISGVIIAVASFILLPRAVLLMGADAAMLNDCVRYGRIILPALPFLMLQYGFQSFLIVAERPNLGLVVTIISGMTNMVLDALFMAVFRWGLAGAAVATAISQVIGGLLPLIYFSRPNTSLLRLGRCRFDGRALAKACMNGSSELMSNISMSLVNMLYNMQLMRFAGEDGVAAYGVIMYINMIFLAIFIGYSTGVAPVVGFHYGAAHEDELKGLLRRSVWIIGVSSVGMFALSEGLARPLSAIFVSYDAALMDMTLHAFRIYSFSFLFSGFSIFGSSFFTALNDGLISALISFLRTLVFQVAAVLVFPMIWRLDGVWISIVAAEVMAVVVTGGFVVRMRPKYRYY